MINTDKKKSHLWHGNHLFYLLVLPLIFALDFSLEIGATVPVLYVVVVYFVSQTGTDREILICAALSSFFTVLGVFLSPTGAAAGWVILVNRGLSLFVVWVGAIFILQRKRREFLLHSYASVLTKADIAVILIDHAQKVYWCDASFEKLSGLTRRQLQGIDIEMLCKLLNWDSKQFAASYANADEEFIVPIINSGQEIWVSVEWKIFEDKQSLNLESFILFHDVTLQKEQELEIASELQYVEAVIDCVPEPIFVCDSESTIELSNQAFKDRFPIANHVFDLKINEETCDEALITNDNILTAVKHVAKSNRELRNVELTSSWHGRFLLSSIPLNRSQQNSQSFVISLVDVSKLKKAEEILAASVDDLKQFAYVASHDLQEPLRKIVSFLQILEEDHAPSLNADAKECIEIAVDGASRLRVLIQDLLLYYAIDRPSRESFDTIHLPDVVEEARSLLELEIEETNTMITYTDLPSIMGNKSQLVQLLQNLISNAIKYRHEDRSPVIEISAIERNRYYEISLKDNGIGMESEFFMKIFKLFQRLHSRSEASGTGIGLAICKKIVERHGGKIWVNAELDKGSQFNLMFPKSRQEE